MYGPSDYDFSPGGDMYGPSGYDSYQPQGPQIDIKKYLPMIIGLGVLLVIGFVLLNFLGSQKTVSIRLTDLDGKVIKGNILLTDEKGNPVETLPEGEASRFTANLFPGNYFLRVDAVGYESKSSERIVITDDDKDPPAIKLTRDLDATLQIDLESEEMYSSQVIEGRLIVYNTGNEFNSNDIKANASSPIEITIHKSSINEIKPNGTALIDFSMKVLNPEKITSEVISNIYFSVNGSNLESNKINVSVKPVVPITKMTVSGNFLITNKPHEVTADEQVQMEIKIKNSSDSKSKIPLKDLYLEIEADLGFENNIDWITIGGSDSPNEAYIPLIEYNKDETIVIFIKTRPNQKKGDEFRGRIKINSLSLSDPYVSSSISIKVKKEREASIAFTMGKEFKIKCTDKGCEGEQNLINKITMKNNSLVDVGPINIRVNFEAEETTSNCPSFFKLITTKIDNIKSKETYTTISAEVINPVASAGDETAICLIEWDYNDPYDPTVKEGGRHAVTIIKTTT